MKKVFALLVILVLAFSAFSVTITMTAGAVGTELETLYKQIDMFMQENPDITVQVMPMPNSSTDRHDLYVTYLASGVPDPDVLMLDVIWPAEFAPFLVDLTDDYNYFELDEFFPGTVDSNTVDGRLVSVPWFTDAGILYYRKDLLQNTDTMYQKLGMNCILLQKTFPKKKELMDSYGKVQDMKV